MPLQWLIPLALGLFSVTQAAQAQRQQQQLLEQQLSQAERLRQEADPIRQALMAAVQQRLDPNWVVVSPEVQEQLYEQVAARMQEQAEQARRALLANLAARGVVSSGMGAAALERFEQNLARALGDVRQNIGLQAQQQTEAARQAAMNLANIIANASDEQILRNQDMYRQQLESLGAQYGQLGAQFLSPILSQWLASLQPRTQPAIPSAYVLGGLSSALQQSLQPWQPLRVRY